MKRALILPALFFIAGSLAAFDFGGYVDNTTGVAKARAGIDAPVELVQSTTVALWLDHRFGGWTLDAQGSYRYTPAVPLLFDVDRLALGTRTAATEAGAATFGFTVGRTTFTDPTAFVLDHTLDGLTARVGRSHGSYEIGIATTALLQKPTNGIILSEPDAADLDDPSVLFAPPRVVTSLRYRGLEVVAGQDLVLGVMIQEDLRRQSELTPVGTELPDPTAGGRVDTQYVTLGFSGALGPGLFHRTYYVLNSGRRLAYVASDTSGTGAWYQYEAFLAHAAATEVAWFLPDVLNSRARLFGLFSTGDSGWSDRFVPLTSSSFSDVFTLEPDNSAHLGISYSMRPLTELGTDILQTELRSVSYFRSTGGGAVSEPAVDPAKTGAYVGTDINLVLTLVPLSDLRFVLKTGAFVPNASVMTAGNEAVDYQGTLQGVLRF
jgi:hypothetical protein